MARYPDVVDQSFDFSGSGAEEIAKFLNLDQLSSDGPKDRLYFIQPQDYQQRADKRFWEKITRPDGSIDGNFLMPTSNCIQWNRLNKGLFVSGLWLDHDTGSHTVDLLRYEFIAPLGMSKPAKDSMPDGNATGWEVLINHLRRPQKSNASYSERRSFKLRPMPTSESGWWDRLTSYIPWTTTTLEFRVDFDDKDQATYARISIGPWRRGHIPRADVDG